MVTEALTGLDIGGEVAAGGLEGFRCGGEALGGGAVVCVDGTQQAIEQGLRKNDIVE